MKKIIMFLLALSIFATPVFAVEEATDVDSSVTEEPADVTEEPTDVTEEPAETVTPSDIVIKDENGMSHTLAEILEAAKDVLNAETPSDRVDAFVSRFGWVGIVALLVCVVVALYIKVRLIPKVSMPVQEIAKAIPEYLNSRGDTESKGLQELSEAMGEFVKKIGALDDLGVSASKMIEAYPVIFQSMVGMMEMLNMFVQKSNASQHVKDSVEAFCTEQKNLIAEIKKAGD